MKRFLKIHQQGMLIISAIAVLVVLAGFGFWVLKGLIVDVNQALIAAPPAAGTVQFNIDDARQLVTPPNQ